jgi:quercetin 2,3-dioxygenase
MTTNLVVRPVQKTWKSKPTIEGAGVHLRRAFGFQEMPGLDPFLLMDDFRSENPKDYQAGFPWHPHRGMETITYVLEGDVEHGDSLGNSGVISSGDIQWMTAGSGIVHQEMPQGDRKGRMFGFQLWSNLPKKDKMMDPRYQEVKQADIPVVKTGDGASVRVVAGEVEGVRGPVQDIVSDPEYLDVSIPAGKTFTHATKADHTVFAYIFEGEGIFDPSAGASGDGTLVLYGAGSQIEVKTEQRPLRFLLVSGKPLKEPIAWYGPIVMNTQQEIRAAFREFEEGTFVKKSGR